MVTSYLSLSSVPHLSQTSFFIVVADAHLHCPVAPPPRQVGSVKLGVSFRWVSLITFTINVYLLPLRPAAAANGATASHSVMVINMAIG